MEYYIERLSHELKNIMKFWQDHVILNNKIATEVSNDGTAKFDTPLGCIYLSRILYGASAACRHLNDPVYKPMADLAYQTLITKMANPSGGFHWAIGNNKTIIHDAENYSFAQTFAVYGLSEYYALTSDPEVLKKLTQLINFIETKIKNSKDGGYMDGFSPDWLPLSEQKRSLGTHLHMLEALVKFTQITKDPIYKKSIENLIEILIHRFIDVRRGEVHHLLNYNWKPEPSEIWIGHSVETGWILKKSANIIQHKEYITSCNQIHLALCNNAIEKGFDKQYGGIFNRFKDNKLVSTNKEWWPQAESVIAFLSAYHDSGDKKYLSYAIRLLEYIDNTFSDQKFGEWYDTVTREGKPVENVLKLHMWKSMHHNVRYCIEVSKHLQKVFATV